MPHSTRPLGIYRPLAGVGAESRPPQQLISSRYGSFAIAISHHIKDSVTASPSNKPTISDRKSPRTSLSGGWKSGAHIFDYLDS